MTIRKSAFLILFSLLCSSFTLFSQSSESLISSINARDWSGDSAFPIIGSCHFYDQQLLTPEECSKSTGVVANFPELWVPKRTDESGLGFATYSLLIVLPHNHPKDLALSVPQMYSSYKLWINGKATATNGVVGKSIKECIPQWLPQTVSIHMEEDSLNIVLQIANFHHAKGGIKEPIYLGTSAQMQLKRTVAVISNLTESVTLFLLGIFFLFIFISQTKKKVTLYLALLCLTWSLRSIFSNLYISIAYFPDFDWATLLRIEYITLYLTMIWAILFLSQIFLNEANVIIKYALIFCNLLFTAFTLFSSPRIFTQWLTLYLSVAVVLLVYSGFTVIRAWVNERVGSGLLTISIVLGLNIFAYDIFVYEGFSSYDPFIFSLGYITIFSLMSWALAMHLGLIKSKPSPTTSLTYDDLFKKER
jgi:hypothetical protein